MRNVPASCYIHLPRVKMLPMKYERAPSRRRFPGHRNTRRNRSRRLCGTRHPIVLGASWHHRQKPALPAAVAPVVRVFRKVMRRKSRAYMLFRCTCYGLSVRLYIVRCYCLGYTAPVAASRVLRISMAMVMGPTPPGTGVM